VNFLTLDRAINLIVLLIFVGQLRSLLLVVDLAHQCSRHQLVDLDVRLLNLSSQNVFDLLLILHRQFLRGWSSVIGNLLLLLD
jgi:hypothetical protein